MSNDLRTKLVLDLAGNLAQRARQFQDALQSMGTRSARSMALMKKSTALAGQGLDALSNRYTAILGGAGMASGISNVVKMDKSLRLLQVTSGKTAEEMKGIQAQLLATAQASHIRIDYSELEAGVAQVAEMTGDLDWALANRETMAMTISASGASGDAVGAFMSELQKLGLTADQTQEAIARMLSQGKDGAFTLQNLASLGPRVVSAYATSGRRGTDMLKEMGAVLQMIRRTSGSAEMSATSFESLMRAFSNNKVLKDLQKRGIQVFDLEKLKQGEKVLRPVTDLIEEIVIKSKGDMTKISGIFTDSEASRAFNSFINEFKDTGEFKNLDKFMAANADVQVLVDDSKVMADSYAALLSNLNNAWMEFATSEMGGPVEDLATGLRSLKQEDVQRWMDMGKTLLYVGAGAIAARKLWQTGMAVKKGVDWWRATGAGGQPAEGAGGRGGRGGFGGMKLPVPVYMVNPPRGLPSSKKPSPGKPSGTPGSSKPATPIPSQKRTQPAGKNWSQKGAGVVAVATNAAFAIPVLLSSDASREEKVQASGEAAGGIAGGVLGSYIGAAIGTVIAPGIGTALGAWLGGAIGGWAGHEVGGEAAEQINQSLDVTVKLEGTPGTKAEVTEMRSSTDTLNTNVYYGQGMR